MSVCLGGEKSSTGRSYLFYLALGAPGARIAEASPIRVGGPHDVPALRAAMAAEINAFCVISYTVASRPWSVSHVSHIPGKRTRLQGCELPPAQPIGERSPRKNHTLIGRPVYHKQGEPPLLGLGFGRRVAPDTIRRSEGRRRSSAAIGHVVSTCGSRSPLAPTSSTPPGRSRSCGPGSACSRLCRRRVPAEPRGAGAP